MKQRGYYKDSLENYSRNLRGMDTLVLPAGEAKRVEVYSVNGMLVMTQEKCTSVGLSALPVGYYMARAYMEDGRVQVCKIMK